MALAGGNPLPLAITAYAFTRRASRPMATALKISKVYVNIDAAQTYVVLIGNHSRSCILLFPNTMIGMPNPHRVNNEN